MLRDEFKKFAVIFEEKSLSRAADRLDLYQGSLSKLLGKLEAELERPLFIRSNRGMVPTPEGRRLYNQVRSQERQWEEFRHASSQESKDIYGSLRVGSHSSVIGQFAKGFAQLHKELPFVEIDYSFERSPQVTRRILNHELDIGLVANPQTFHELVIRPLKEEQVGLFSANMKPTSLIFFNPELITTPQILKRVKDRKTRLIPINDYNIAASLAKESGGSAILPESVALKQGLKVLSGRPYFVAKLALIYRADHRKDSLVKAALQILKSSN